MINSYPSVYALSHKGIEDLLLDSVIIEEKVDGSQFSFGNIKGQLQFRSHNCEVFIQDSTSMFHKAVEYVQTISHLLIPEWIYRGEFLSKPKHNVLCYSRTPKNFIAIYDIDNGLESYMAPQCKADNAGVIGLETVPLLWVGDGSSISMELLNKLLGQDSFLGNTTIEGVVIKNYARFGLDKKVLMGKYVSERFKERNQGEHKSQNPTNKDIVFLLGQQLRTEARWQKAIQHLQEQGLLQNSPADIGLLLKEISEDVEKEETDFIKEQLFNHFRKNILRNVTAGFPEWYKQSLASKQFSG